ncbi:MAG: cysteine synthase family protein [Candidatus Babeliaceae bacterium]|nr:cysteine synthase family protein [Candidatus Babeliaceae bacterium]
MKTFENLLHAIGNTPLVRIPFDSQGNVYAKLEYLNPGGSIKDRAALFMIEEAERTGLLKPGGTLIEASSGNQGIATALIGAIKGYKVVITISEKISEEKQKTLQAYGAQLISCKPTLQLDDPNGYHAKAVEIHRSTPNSFMLNQYFNPTNSAAHYAMLGPEIWQQTHGNVTHYMAAAGSGGTVSGAGKYLKEKNHTLKVIAVDVENSYRSTNKNPKPYKLEGIGVDYDTPHLRNTIIDKYELVNDHDSIAMLQTMARKYGFLVGPSSGAVACAAERVARNLQKNDTMVIIFGDSGRAYLTKNFY